MIVAGMTTASSCGSGLIAWGSCKAGAGIIDGLGHALLAAIMWPLRAFISPGQAPNGQQLAALLVVAAGTYSWHAWTRRTAVGNDLRDAASIVADAIRPHPRLARYLGDVGRGSGRVLGAVALPIGWALAHRRGRLGRLVLLALAAYVVAGALGYWIAWLPGVVLVPAAVHGLAVLGRRPTPSTDWWSEHRLMGALIESGVVPRPRVGQPPPALHRHGPPRHSDAGVAVKLGLPGAVTVAVVQAHREALAAALRVPAAALVVTASPQDAANVVTIFVRSASAPAPAPPDDAARGAEQWGDPLRIGVDHQHRAVLFQTTGMHSLLAGATGSGKTVAARRFVARAMLTPDVRLMMLDGKGSGADWAGLVPLLAEPPVQVGQADLGRRAVELIDRVLELGREHDSQRHRGAPSGCLVLVEEWGALRSSVPAGVERRDLDAAMARLLQLGRSAGTHVLLITQRPTQGSLPTDQGVNVRQRLVLPCVSDEEASHGLGEWPVAARLSAPGAGLLVTPGHPQVQVTVDNLTDAVWEALCARAAALRGIGRPVALVKASRPASLVKVTPEPAVVGAEALVAEALVDPLLETVCELLSTDPAGLSAALLLDLIPEALTPPSSAALGRFLARHPDVVRRGWKVPAGSRRSVQVWQLASPAQTPGSPAQTPALPPRTPADPPRSPAATPAQSCPTPAQQACAGEQVGQTTPPTPSQGGVQAPAGVPAGDLDAAGQP